MIGRALKLDDTARSTGFKDVSARHPFSGYIASAIDEEIISSFPNHTFRPDRKVTRAQAAVMLDKAFYFLEAPYNMFRDVKKIITHLMPYPDLSIKASLKVIGITSSVLKLMLHVLILPHF